MKTRGFLPRGRWTRDRNQFWTSGLTRASSPHDGPLVTIPGRMEYVVHFDVAVMFDVLHLLPVTWGFFQSLDNQSCGRGYNVDLSLTILDGKSDSDLETLPFLSGFDNVVTNFLG